jgi:DNA-binding transcriptional LysR family regulator
LQVQRAATDAYFDLRLGTVDSLGTHVLPACLTRLQANHPELKLKLWMARTQSLLERVDRGSLDLAFVAYSAPPTERSERVGSYSMKYYGRSDRFPELAEFKTELELRSLPVVEIEALAGQPSLIHTDADAFAITQNLSAVKALVLAGLGVGQMLPFMLSDEERERVVCAEQIQHDPDCGVYAVRSFRAFSERESQMQAELLALIAAQLSGDRDSDGH